MFQRNHNRASRAIGIKQRDYIQAKSGNDLSGGKVLAKPLSKNILKDSCRCRRVMDVVIIEIQSIIEASAAPVICRQCGVERFGADAIKNEPAYEAH